jgi:hypothetical protein
MLGLAPGNRGVTCGVLWDIQEHLEPHSCGWLVLILVKGAGRVALSEKAERIPVAASGNLT